jgi:hypothetical protein
MKKMTILIMKSCFIIFIIIQTITTTTTNIDDIIYKSNQMQMYIFNNIYKYINT